MGAVEIATALGAARKAVTLYPPEHPTHREAVRDLTKAVNDAIDVRPLVLNLKEGRLYEGSSVITEASPATRALADAMEIRRVESLTFHMGFSEHDAWGLSEALGLRPSPELQVSVELETRGVRAATVSELEDNTAKEAEERDRQREADRSLYRATLAGLKNMMARLEEGEEIQSFEVTRPVPMIIERIAEDPCAIVALSNMTGHGERWRFHAVGVMLLSLVIGQRMGLSDRELIEVGLAGLLHDAGRFICAPETLADVQADHPICGARALGVIADEDCIAMLVAYEHHMGADASGYPEPPAGYSVHPFTRLVSVANRYYNLVHPLEGPPMRPDEAAEAVLGEVSSGQLSSGAARLFLRTLGPIPIGCTVRLSDHSVALVRCAGDDPFRPHLRLILRPDGTEMKPTIDVSLMEDERTIVEVLPGELLGVDVSEYL